MLCILFIFTRQTKSDYLTIYGMPCPSLPSFTISQAFTLYIRGIAMCHSLRSEESANISDIFKRSRFSLCTEEVLVDCSSCFFSVKILDDAPNNFHYNILAKQIL